MLTTSNSFKTAISAPKRSIKAKAELFNGSALAATYTQNDAIKSIDIDRVGEDSKFFGFGVSHKMNIKLIDVNREKDISTSHSFVISIGVETSDGVVYTKFPRMYVTEVHRDENTNELSITAYDLLYNIKTSTVSELTLTTPYTVGDFITACGAFLGVPVAFSSTIDTFSLSYEEGANFEGTETIYEALTAAAEVTQTIFYINANNELVFKRLDTIGNAALNISKNDYITLDSGDNRRLQTIASVTELGDNVSVSTTQFGTTQYMRNNPFIELRDDIADVLDKALAAVGNMTINQFNCDWRGNTALEIGDKISLVTKDNQTVTSYLLNDTVSYNGALAQKTKWQYTESEDTPSNPATLGERLKQTYAKVDKANKTIDMVASETTANSEAISSLQLNTDSINASVQKIQENTSTALEGVNEDIASLTNKLELAMTAEDVTLAIKSEMANGVSKVETTTGFTFNDEGLTVSKSGTEMTTQITEDGMAIRKDNEEMLVANNKGVTAYDLHAKTYLIIGESSRFEDYDKDGETRTGCFWIG